MSTLGTISNLSHQSAGNGQIKGQGREGAGDTSVLEAVTQCWTDTHTCNRPRVRLTQYKRCLRISLHHRRRICRAHAKVADGGRERSAKGVQTSPKTGNVLCAIIHPVSVSQPLIRSFGIESASHLKWHPHTFGSVGTTDVSSWPRYNRHFGPHWGFGCNIETCLPRSTA